MHKLLINRISIALSFGAGIDCSSFTPSAKDGAIDSSLYKVYELIRLYEYLKPQKCRFSHNNMNFGIFRFNDQVG